MPHNPAYNKGVDTPGTYVDMISVQIMLLEQLNVYVTCTQTGMLKLWNANTLQPVRAIENGDGGE